MGEKLLRVMTAVVLVPLVLLLVFSGNKLLVGGVLLAVIIIATYEFVVLQKNAGIELSYLPALAGAVSLPLAFYLESFFIAILGFFFVVFFSFMTKMITARPVSEVYLTVSSGVMSALYAPFLLSFLFPLWQMNPHWLVYLLVIIWLSDTCAYFTGMNFGKRKLCPNVSPKKTWEGLFGGLAGGVLGAFVYSALFLPLPWWFVLISAVDVVAAGVLGDLFESMLKRDAGVKDSGTLFPGHGGMLDRIDSLMFGAPVLFFYITFLSEKL